MESNCPCSKKKIQDSMSVPSSREQLSVQQETRLYISSGFLLDGCDHNTLCVIMLTTAIMERVGCDHNTLCVIMLTTAIMERVGYEMTKDS